MAQNVTYLLGSGATHGVVRQAENGSLLTRDIQDYIGNKLLLNGGATLTDRIWNEITKKDRDVEHLITVLDCQYKNETAVQAREYYRQAIVDLVARLKSAGGPNLYTYLVDLHLHGPLRKTENLLCFLSLNYEDLLERSITDHFPKVEVSYGLETEPRTKPAKGKKLLPVFKLHGSFNWKNTRPIVVAPMANMSASEYPLWIPPGVDKKREHYPFNLLWGKAVELIAQTDILRVIGCSLSRNDWGLIPILYSAQSLSEPTRLKIQLIDYTESADRIKANYKYLQFTDLPQLDEIQNFKPTGSSSLDETSLRRYFSESNAGTINVFEQWLRAKIELLFTDKRTNSMRDDKLSKSAAKFAASFYQYGK